MKKNDGLIALGAIGFAVLFYEQAPGINYLLFSGIFVILSTVINYQTNNRNVYFALFLHLLTGVNIFIVHSDLALWAWFFSISYAVGKIANKESSYLFSLFYSMASPFTAFEKMFGRYFKFSSEQPKKRNWTYILAAFISFMVLLIFFFLYKGANPLFDAFTKKIDFSWLDFPFVLYCILGFWILFSILNPYFDTQSNQWDSSKLKQRIINKETETGSEFVKLIIFISIFIFIGLNLMLLVLNSLDVRSIFILEKLPENIFLSDFLHFAVTSIVISILLAILIIGSIQQFSIGNKLVKLLIYSWIIQSLIMVINTFIRNYWYSFNQITYLRIGVFVFLTMCILGLLYTAYSLHKDRNYWFLLNLNFQTWYFVLLISSFFSWDRLVTKHNLSYEKKSEIDLNYLLDLSDNNLDLIHSFSIKNPELFEQNNGRGYFRSTTYKSYLANRQFKFIQRVKYQKWQAYNLADEKQISYLKTTKRE
jgi:hypothetical protein